MKVLILLPMLATCALAQYYYTGYDHAYPTYTHAVAVPQTSTYHNQDSLGQYSYGYTTPTQSKTEVKDAAGHVAGAYKYVTPNAGVVQVQYTADEQGFKVHSVPEHRYKRQVYYVTPGHHSVVAYPTHHKTGDTSSVYHHQNPAGFSYGYSTVSHN